MFKAIITGLGGQGLNWVRQVRTRTDVEAVAFVEPHAPNRERAVQTQGVPEKQIFKTLAEAIKAVKADFVIDVTPPAVHHVVAEEAFAAGLHVLGEKPLSDDYSIAKKVVAAGKKAGLKHMLAQNYRFNNQPRTTRKVLSEGLIGQPGQCDVRFYMPWADAPGSHYVTQPYMVINDMMIHHFDLIRYVLATDPINVHAITWNHSWGWHKGDAAHAIVFEFPGGLHATHVTCGCAVGSQTSWNGDWRIEGPKGSITWDQRGMWHQHLHRTQEKTNREIFPLNVPSGQQGILDEFVAALKENRAPECNAEDNIKSVAMVFAAIKSAKEGRRVKLEELS